MNATDLNAAMQYIDDQYLDMAETPQKEIIEMSKTRRLTRIFLIAAVIAVLVVTAYAADVLNVKSLYTGTSDSYSDYSQVKKAMRQAGFDMDIQETFDTGFQFELIRVQETEAMDENGSKVLSYKNLAVYYRNEDGNRLVLSAEPKQEEIPETDHGEGLTREIAGISATYWQDHYKFVPEDYELTEAEKEWQEQPGNFVTYGSDKVEESAPGFLAWEKNGIRYFFMDPRGNIPADSLFSMAEKLITAS